MSHGHSHSHDMPAGAVKSTLRVRIVTFALLAVVAAATAIGLVTLWPDYQAVEEVGTGTQYAAEGATFETGEVLSVTDECPVQQGGQSQGSADPQSNDSQAAQAEACLEISVGLHSGPEKGRLVNVVVRGALASSGISVGDHVELSRFPGVSTDAGSPEGAESGANSSTDTGASEASYELAETYALSGIFRHIPLLILTLVFVAVVIFVGRLRGFLALVALGISAGVLFAFVLPGLVAGEPGLLVGMVGASTIMFVILYLVHGLNMRTTAALIGTLCGILIMAGISLISVHVTRLSGISDESSSFLQAASGSLDFRGLLTCSIIIAGLGVLNDVTITQASSVWELRAAAPTMPSDEVYRRAMRIGRDHIASTVYTVFFAYVGAALGVLIMLYLYGQPFLSLLTREDIAIEIVRTLCGSIGLILAVPITTWVAALFARPALPETAPTVQP